MKSEFPDLTNILDQSVLASLRHLQDEGDPDIVAEVGGLFLKHSLDRVQGPPGGGGKKRCQGPPARSAQPQVQQSLLRGHAPLRLAIELEMMGRSGTLERAREGAEKLRVELHLAVKAASRESWLRPAAEAR